jgi:hypothetical protein
VTVTPSQNRYLISASHGQLPFESCSESFYHAYNVVLKQRRHRRGISTATSCGAGLTSKLRRLHSRPRAEPMARHQYISRACSSLATSTLIVKLVSHAKSRFCRALLDWGCHADSFNSLAVFCKGLHHLGTFQGWDGFGLFVIGIRAMPWLAGTGVLLLVMAAIKGTRGPTR